VDRAHLAASIGSAMASRITPSTSGVTICIGSGMAAHPMAPSFSSSTISGARFQFSNAAVAEP
jgi:hypothetical protein